MLKYLLIIIINLFLTGLAIQADEISYLLKNVAIDGDGWYRSTDWKDGFGLDEEFYFSTENGDTVYSVGYGQVDMALTDSLRKKLGYEYLVVIVKHFYDKNDTESYYYGLYNLLKDIFVTEGQWIEKGHPIATADGSKIRFSTIGLDFPVIIQLQDTLIILPNPGFKSPRSWLNTSVFYSTLYKYDFGPSCNYSSEQWDTTSTSLISPELTQANSSVIYFYMKKLPSTDTLYLHDGQLADVMALVKDKNDVWNYLPILNANADYSFREGDISIDEYNVYKVDCLGMEVKQVSLDVLEKYQVRWIKILMPAKRDTVNFYEIDTTDCDRQAFKEEWNNSDNLSNWKSLRSSISYDIDKGNPGASLKVKSNNIRHDEIGVSVDKRYTGNLACNNITGINFDIKTPDMNFFEVRLRCNINKAWKKIFTREDFKINSWSHLSVKLDPTWSDSEAIANGWEQESPLRVISFAENLNLISALEIYGITHFCRDSLLQFNIDNFQVCYDATCTQTDISQIYPKNLIVIQADRDSAMLRWNSIPTSQYIVYKDTSPIDTISDTFYVDRNINQSLISTYSVIGLDNGSMSGISDIITMDFYKDIRQYGDWRNYTSARGTKYTILQSDTDKVNIGNTFMDMLIRLEGNLNVGWKLFMNDSFNLDMHAPYLDAHYRLKSWGHYRITHYLETKDNDTILLVFDTRHRDKYISKNGELRYGIGPHNDGSWKRVNHHLQHSLNEIAVALRKVPKRITRLIEIRFKCDTVEMEIPTFFHDSTNAMSDKFYIRDTSIVLANWDIRGNDSNAIVTKFYEYEDSTYCTRLLTTNGMATSFKLKFDEPNVSQFFSYIGIKNYTSDFRMYYEVLVVDTVNDTVIDYDIAYDTRNWTEKRIAHYVSGRDARIGIGDGRFGVYWHSYYGFLQEDLDSVCSAEGIPKMEIIGVLGISFRIEREILLYGLHLGDTKKDVLWTDRTPYTSVNHPDHYKVWKILGTKQGTSLNTVGVFTEFISDSGMATLYKFKFPLPNTHQFYGFTNITSFDPFRLFVEVITNKNTICRIAYDTRYDKGFKKMYSNGKEARVGIGAVPDTLIHDYNFDLKKDLIDVSTTSGIDTLYPVAVTGIYLRTGNKTRMAPFELRSNPQPDYSPPQPNPLSWEVAPVIMGHNSIMMEAVEATDENGVEYHFECIGGPCHNSKWQESPIYVDTGIYNPNLCTYRVRAIDNSPRRAYNITHWSVPGSAVAHVAPTIGYTTIFPKKVTTTPRRAMPFTMPYNDYIDSIAIYHGGGTGNLILAVYDGDNVPENLLGITPQTNVNSNEGWQTISLTTPVNILAGTKIWLAWVFENATEVRYEEHDSGRALVNGSSWSDGMPNHFGSSTVSNYVYSIYAIYRNSP